MRTSVMMTIAPPPRSFLHSSLVPIAAPAVSALESKVLENSPNHSWRVNSILAYEHARSCSNGTSRRDHDSHCHAWSSSLSAQDRNQGCMKSSNAVQLHQARFASWLPRIAASLTITLLPCYKTTSLACKESGGGVPELQSNVDHCYASGCSTSQLKKNKPSHAW